MKALHRLVGNTPKRGFGAGLFSPGFPGGFSILANTDIRLPMTNVPGERTASPVGGPVEAYRAFEVQPLRYGLVAAFQSVKINIEGSRPSSYTNTVIPSGEEVGENVTAGPGIRAILRFNGFISNDAFLNLSRNALDVTEWTCVDEAVLDRYTLPAGVTPEKHRAFLNHYWRAATVQRFGPWDARTGQCVYEQHPLMREYLPLRYTVVLCLGPDGYCDHIIDAARGFMWKYVLGMLPGAVSNIASMSAAVPARFISSIYRNTALAIVYPEQNDNIKFDFRSGATLEISPAEDRFMQKILRGEKPAFLADVVRRYCELTGITDESDISFLADYDVAWQLEQLESSDLPLRERIKSWFAVNQYLEDRHGLSRQQIHRVLAAVDRDVLTRMSAESGEMKAALAPQEDDRHNRTTDLLLTFLWRQALSADDDQFRHIQALLTSYHTPQAEHFFSENLLAAAIDGELEEERAAGLVKDILTTNYGTEQPFSDRQISLMSSEGFIRLCQDHPKVGRVFVGFLEEESRRNPQNMLSSLPLTAQLLPREELMLRLFAYLRQTRVQQLPALSLCGGIRMGMAGLEDASPARAAYADYMTDCFSSHLGELDQVCAMAAAVDADMTLGLISMLKLAAEKRILLSPEQTALLLGEDRRKNLYALCDQKQPVAETFRAYLTGMTLGADTWQEDRSLWMLRLRNAGAACLRDSNGEANVRNWIEELFLRYVAERGKRLMAVPGADTFAKLETLAGVDGKNKREPAFERLSPLLLEMYESILDGGDSTQCMGAIRQIRTLLPGMTSTLGYPHIIQLELQTTCEKLKENWKNNAYWRGLYLLEGDLRRSQLDWKQLLTRDVTQAGISRLNQDLAPLTTYQEFHDKFNEYKNNPKNEFPPKTMERTFSQVCFERLQAHFVDRFDSQVTHCGDIGEMQHLQEYSEKTMLTAPLTNETAGGRCIRAVRSVQTTLNSLADQDDVGAMLQKAMKCAQVLTTDKLPRTECYHRALNLLNKHFLETRRDELAHRAFHTRLSIGLVCNISPESRSIRWRDVIAQLCPGYQGMMRSPFSTAEISLFQTIRYMFSTLSNQVDDLGQPSLKWAKSLANFLNNDEEFAAYSAKVRKDKRALRQFLPFLLEPGNNTQEAQALKMWLGTDTK